MLHAEFLCNDFWCDFLSICFFDPCALTNLEVFIDILLIQQTLIILDRNISAFCP